MIRWYGDGLGTAGGWKRFKNERSTVKLLQIFFSKSSIFKKFELGRSGVLGKNMMKKYLYDIDVIIYKKNYYTQCF